LPSRYFSVQAATATVNENFVKEAIKKMMLDRDQEDDNAHLLQHPISDDELKSRFESFQVSDTCPLPAVYVYLTLVSYFQVSLTS
jgi:hypothetical protein